MASLAQQESQSISQNVRLGLQYRYQQGKVQVNTKRFLGYDKDKDGNLVINPEEAKVVRRIYREYLEGKSYYAILEQLEALRDAKQELVLEDADNVNAKRHLAMIEAFLETQQTEIQEYDEDLVRKLLHRVTVYDDHLTFEFKSGLEVEISM